MPNSSKRNMVLEMQQQTLERDNIKSPGLAPHPDIESLAEFGHLIASEGFLTWSI